MGPTKPSENLFFRGIWGWASTLWERLQSTGGRLHTALHGYDGTNWQKLALLWGYEDAVAEVVLFTVTIAGSNQVNTTAVPAGEVHRITTVCAYNTAVTASPVFLILVRSATVYRMVVEVSLAANTGIYNKTDVILKPGDVIRFQCVSLGVGDVMRLYVTGYKMPLS